MICTLSHPCSSPDLAGVDRWKRKRIGRGGGAEMELCWADNTFIAPQKSCLALMPWTTLNHAARMRGAQSILQCSVPQNTLDSIYMYRTCPELKGHPPSRDNLSERLYEKKVDSSARANSASTCSDCLSLTELYGEKVDPSRGVTLPSQKGDPARWVTFLA